MVNNYLLRFTKTPILSENKFFLLMNLIIFVFYYIFNIYKIAEAAINKLERPSYLCREIKVITPLNRVWDKQTLHGNEKPNLETLSIYTEGGGFKSSRV